MNNLYIHKIEYNKFINYSMLTYAFFLPLSRAGIVFFSMVLILLWLLEGGFKKKFRLISRCKVLLALGAFILYNIISLLWSSNIVEALDYVKKYWYFLPMVVIYTSAKKNTIHKMLSFFIAGMFISEILAYGVFFELWHFGHATPQNPTPFMHHIEYSVFLAFASLLLLTQIFHVDQWRIKMLYSVFFATITGNLFLTGGRTGQLAFLIGLFVVAMINFKNKLKAFLVFLFLAALLFGLAYRYSETFQKRVVLAKQNLLQIEEKKGYCSSWGARVGTWIVAQKMIAKDPVLGVGIADNMEEFYRLIRSDYPEMICNIKVLMHMHNQYLQIWTQNGLIGLILFLSIFFFIYRIRPANIEYRNIKSIYLTVILFAFVSDVLFHRQFSMALFALIAGLLTAQKRVEHAV